MCLKEREVESLVQTYEAADLTKLVARSNLQCDEDLDNFRKALEKGGWLRRTVLFCYCVKGEDLYKTVFFKRKISSIVFGEEGDPAPDPDNVGMRWICHTNKGWVSHVCVQAAGGSIRFVRLVGDLVFRDSEICALVT